jgi:hypothetical protein
VPQAVCAASLCGARVSLFGWRDQPTWSQHQPPCLVCGGLWPSSFVYDVSRACIQSALAWHAAVPLCISSMGHMHCDVGSSGRSSEQCVFLGHATLCRRPQCGHNQLLHNSNSSVSLHIPAADQQQGAAHVEPPLLRQTVRQRRNHGGWPVCSSQIETGVITGRVRDSVAQQLGETVTVQLGLFWCGGGQCDDGFCGTLCAQSHSLQQHPPPALW